MDTFDVFLKKLEAIVEDLTIADDRRHGVANMSQFLIISDLTKQVKARVPEETNPIGVNSNSCLCTNKHAQENISILY